MHRQKVSEFTLLGPSSTLELSSASCKEMKNAVSVMIATLWPSCSAGSSPFCHAKNASEEIILSPDNLFIMFLSIPITHKTLLLITYEYFFFQCYRILYNYNNKTKLTTWKLDFCHMCLNSIKALQF